MCHSGRKLAKPYRTYAATAAKALIAIVLSTGQFYPNTIMDLSKYPLDKLASFIGAIIPGFVALLVFHLAKPWAFEWFFRLGFLGYNTKLALIIVTAFVIGISLTTFLNSFFGAIGGAIGGFTYKYSSQYDIAPWRNPRWRKLVREHLGAKAPNDSHFIPWSIFEMKRDFIAHLPEAQQAQALNDLNAEKANSDIDDADWQQWYHHYRMVVREPDKQDFAWNVHSALRLNLQTTGVYILISSAVVPSVRRWWCIVPACMWVMLLFAEIYTDFRRVLDDWSTLNDQIRYLSLADSNKESSENAASAN